MADTWFDEALYPSWGQRFRVVREIARVRSQHQDILIFDTDSHGRVMALDGAVQITERDEFVYQEMIAHVPLLAHGRAKRVLIVGAGDGGVLRRVLQHRGVEQATMVEIDAEVIRLAREHLPDIGRGAWDDPRARIVVGDGIAHMRDAPDAAYDVVIVDSTDPAGVGEVLFSDAFYRDCARALAPDGLVVCQSGVPFMQEDELRQTHARRRGAFARAGAYVAAAPTYVGGLMALGWATNGIDPAATPPEEIARRAEADGITGTTSYWTPGVHAASFQLPPYISRLLE